MPFIVNLEPGVWLAKGKGDPPRTCDICHAGEWRTHYMAAKALRKARDYHAFEDATIHFVA